VNKVTWQRKMANDRERVSNCRKPNAQDAHFRCFHFEGRVVRSLNLTAPGHWNSVSETCFATKPEAVRYTFLTTAPFSLVSVNRE
jgi:hypothetical protein